MTNKFYDRNSTQAWEKVYNLGIPIGITRLTSNTGLKYVNNEFIDFGGFLYNQNKNYQFVTSVTGSAVPLLSIKLSAPFNAGIVSQTRSDISTIGGVIFYTYANPISTEYSNDIIKYGADESFTSYIESSNVNEIDFSINGYREFLYLDKANNHPDQPNGWCYDTSNGFGSYNWYFSSSSNVIAPTYSAFGSGLEVVSPNNPYMATLIDYDYFNLDFTFSFTGGNSDDKIEVFLVNQSDLKFPRNSSWGNPIDFKVNNLPGLTNSLSTNGTFSQINLAATNIDGTRRYLVFRPSMVGTRTTTYAASLSIISIVGGYNPLNNLQVLPASYSTVDNLVVDIPESIYTYDSVINGVTYSLSSKIGNGHFRAGIWENGVWNNGWRDDTEVKDFDDVYSAILYAYDISWKIKISGSKASCDSFKVGDKVSIGNIVAIDINENRKLIRDYYSITEIGKYINSDNSETNWIEVSLDTTFPYRRIERDSPNHKIKITKNVWLSGAFFNGYFSGVWNNGLFKGYPKITEMFNTHWIDGFFNGGHFNSNYPNYYFSDVLATTDCNYNNITLVFGTISTGNFINGEPDDYKPGHNLLPGDYITIDKDPLQIGANKVIFNPEYNGICRVLSVNGNNIVVNKRYRKNLHPSFEIGKVTRYAASSVIQNFKFYDTNKSKLKSNESPISSSIFSFNSWIDTNYDTTRSVTLGRDFRSYEPLTGKSFNRNNLYGYPTYDVLSSAARFRNSFDLNYGLYKLGTKYKLFNDFIGDASEFNEPFNPAEPTIANFYNDGWSFSTKNSTDLAFNRSEAVISSDNASIFSTTIQDYIDSGVTGNELYLTATYSGAILNNDRITTKKSRYTVVEFDVVTYSIADSKFTYTNQDTYEIKEIIGSNFQTPATQSNSSIDSGALTAGNIFTFNLGSQENLMNPIVNFDNFNGEVWSVDIQSSGKIIVSGNFTTYGGTATPTPKICRINQDFSLDESFEPQFTLSDRDSNIAFIKVLVVKNDPSLNDTIFVIINYIVSEPASNGTATVKGIVRKFNSNATNSGYNSLEQYEFDGHISDIAWNPPVSGGQSGFLIVVGPFFWFYSPTGVMYVNRMMLFTAIGGLSSYNLNYNNLSTTTTKGFYSSSDYVSTIGIGFSDGSFLIGGRISRFKADNNTTTYFLNGIVKLKIISNKVSVDTTFVTGSSTSTNTKGFTYPTSGNFTLPNDSDNFINRIKVDSSNRIYVVGNFPSYRDTNFNTCANIVRLTSNGTFDTSFVTGQGLNSFAYDIVLNSNSTILYVCGQFSSYNGQSCGKVISIRTNGGGILTTYIGGTLEPSTSLVRTMVLNGSKLVVGGTFSSYQGATTSVVTKTITTSTCGQSLTLLPNDIINLAVEVNLDCTGTDLGNIIINLISPEGKIINIKDISALTSQTKFINTVFDISSTTLLSTGTPPYSGTFSMNKGLQKGIILSSVSYVSDSNTLLELITTNASGDWTIYIQNNTNVYPTLNSWKLITTYKDRQIDSSIEITPSVDLPILHFNNLNYEIGSQPTINNQSNLIYRRMSYLPITQNINHLLVSNSFRFDSVEKTSAERASGFGTNTIKKKYEYFYNKTDLMMSIQGNGAMGASQSMLVLDNIKMYETDMIPFFKYFEDANIYKGIQVPYEGIAPNIDYLNSDFVFVDNITLGLDSINNTIIDTNFVCLPNVLTIASSTVNVITATASPSNVSRSSAVVGGNITIQGDNVFRQDSGILVGLATNPTLEVGVVGNNVYPYNGSGTFSLSVSGLVQDTTYNVRAFARTYELYTNGGVSPTTITYGATTSFTTDAIPPDYDINDYSPTDYSH